MSLEFVLCPDLPLKAAVDLSTHQFKAMKVSGAWGCTLAAAATDRCIGVLQNKPQANQAAQIRVLGVSKMISDGSGTAIAAGDLVGPNASALAVKKATADFNAMGISLDASAALGVIIPVFLIPGLMFRTLLG